MTKKIFSFQNNAFAGAAQVGFRFNSFIALAVVFAFDNTLLRTYMSLLIGLCVPILNFAALWPMAHNASFLREIAKNPLVIGSLSGLCAAIVPLPMPEMLGDILDRIGDMALTLGLLCVGAGMQFRALGKNKRLGVVLLCIKHGINPLVAFVLCKVLFLHTTQALALLIFSALPTATSCYVLAKNMGYSSGYVAGLVSASTILGMPSIALSLYLMQQL